MDEARRSLKDLRKREQQMADHIVERSESGSGMVTGLMIGLLLVVVVGVMAFFVFGRGTGPAAPAPTGQTNVNVPAQQQPQAPSAPNIQVPRQIDVNVNQPAQQAPAGSSN
jgi:hypothetical protein